MQMEENKTRSLPSSHCAEDRGGIKNGFGVEEEEYI
jgi:hypothetical protein